MVQTIKESVKFWLVRWCMPLFVPFWFFTHFSVWQVLFEGDHWQSAMGPMESHQLPSDTIDSENSQKWRISIGAGPPFSHLFKQYFYSSRQPEQKLYTPSQRIFFSSSQSGQKYFWHLFKQYFYFSNQPGQNLHTLSKNILFLQPKQKNYLMLLFRSIKTTKKLFHNKK